MSSSRWLPFTDLRGAHPPRWGADLSAALAVTFLGLPQGIAYAMIAGLPPKVGLYAATLPVILGGLLRSSRFVVTGPTNAVSLLVGGAAAVLAAELGASPLQVATTLAFMVGVFQLSAGLLRLGAIVDYISGPVVLGYITGAGVLIGVGQLHELTATTAGEGRLLGKVSGWAAGLGETDVLALGMGLGTVALILGLRRVAREIPGAIVAVVLGILAAALLDLPARGLRTVADLSPIPAGLPPLTLPSLDGLWLLLPAALAATVLSLVESSAVARSIAAKTGDELDADVEFAGQGVANLAAAFVGSYPVSGSLSRSALTHELGANSRLAGVLSGVFVLVLVLVAGPLLDLTPLPVLAGLLLVIAGDLVNLKRIRSTLRAGLGDGVALVATILGTWTLRLDHAIYLGVGLSIVLFLRRARMLVSRELAVDTRLRLREVRLDDDPHDDNEDDEEHARLEGCRRCPAVRILHLEGSLFFGAAGELRHVLDEVSRDPEVRVLVLRVKRARDLDATGASVLVSLHRRLRAQGRHLLVVGMRQGMMERLERTGSAAAIGAENLFPTEAQWFRAMDRAVERALELAGDHAAHAPCALEQYAERRRRMREEGTLPVQAVEPVEPEEEPDDTAAPLGQADAG